MNDEPKSDIEVTTDVTPEVDKPVEGTDQPTEEPSQDPIKGELDKIQKRGHGKTELEKAIYTKQQIEKRIAELKGDDVEPVAEDDSAPVTVGMLKKIQKEQVAKNALTIAEEQIQDESELELTRYHLQNTIRPSGNATEDLRNARALVNSVKNSQIIQESQRKVTPRRTSSGGSAPGKHEDVFEPTPEETAIMRMKGYDGKPLLSKDDILKARRLQK